MTPLAHAEPAVLAAAAAALVGLAVLLLPGPPRPRAAPRPGGRLDGEVRRRPEVDAPLLLDLVAAVVTAGAAPSAAVLAVAGVVREAGSPAAAVLEDAVSSATPAAPGAAQRRLLAHAPPHLAEVAEALGRALGIAEQTGAPVAALLSSAAAELRRRRRRAAALAAARLGVRVVAPLGLCTLPAFGLLAVAPVLLSLGRGLLG